MINPMINRGLLAKALREVWLSTLLFALAFGGIEAVLAVVLPSFGVDLADSFLRIPLFRNVLGALLGTPVGQSVGPLMFLSVAWVHPVALALLWTHEITFCTRLPVGEIDRGTVDILLGLPVSRWQLYLSETAMWILTGISILLAGLVGGYCGSLNLAPDHRPGWFLLSKVVLNMFCLYLAVGGLSYLISACSDRRGRAVGAIFGVVLASFFLNFLGQFWEPARQLSFLGVLHYYQPFAILQNDLWPLGDMAILTAFGTLSWLAGGIVLARRNICTV